MAGIDVGGRHGKRSVDQEINMVPFIDLLLVTISFLLVTAVWTSMAKLPAAPQVSDRGDRRSKPAVDESSLEVRAGRTEITVRWKQGNKYDDVATITRGAVIDDARALETVTKKAWAAGVATGRVRADGEPVPAALYTESRAAFSEVSALIDAMASPQRSCAPSDKCQPGPAFGVMLASSPVDHG